MAIPAWSGRVGSASEIWAGVRGTRVPGGVPLYFRLTAHKARAGNNLVGSDG